MNPLNVLKERETDFVPEHFTVVPIPTKHEYQTPNSNHVKWWIYNNLDGRFGFQSVDTGTYSTKVEVGFEDPSEATYFSMAYTGQEDNDLF